MKRLVLAFVFLFLTTVSFPVTCAAQGCKHWSEVLARSFFPRQIDEEGLRTFTALSSDEYFRSLSQIEEKSLAELTQGSFQEADFVTPRLRPALERFYQVGSRLYGVDLSAENLALAPKADVNAFATGSHVFFHEGLVHYFLRPANYVASLQGGDLSYQQQNTFTWRDDWNSLYFVLAHEAAHNLMRHRDEIVLGRVLKMFEEYRQAALDHRKDVAHGRKGGGVKRYLWHSLQNFSENMQSAEQQRAREAEADAVALLLLRGSGLDPDIASVAAQRMAMLLGDSGPLGGGSGDAMTEALCSTHPDWIVRIEKIETNLSCVRGRGNVCENHIAYPVEKLLPQLHDGMAVLDKYQEETQRIVESDSSPQLFEVEVKVDPKDAQLSVDGETKAQDKFQLAVGPHVVHVSKAGYIPQDLRIVVFPDVQPKVKIKLKKP